MTSRRQLTYLAMALAAAALLLTWRGSRRDAPPAAPATPDTTSRLEQVERVVAERNKDVGKEARVFEADGWTMVSVPPPDPRVTDLDPSLIAEGREAELRLQVGSVTPSKDKAHRLAQILLLAHDAATREHAALALGRIHTAEAAEEIGNLLTGGKLDPDDLGRRQLAASLRPTDLDDEVAARMANLLDAKALTGPEKEQIAFTLALVGLRDGMELPDRVLATVSPEARALIHHMTEMGQKSFLAHGDVHSAHKE